MKYKNLLLLFLVGITQNLWKNFTDVPRLVYLKLRTLSFP